MSIFGEDLTDNILGDDLNKNISGDELPGSDNEQNDDDGDKDENPTKVEPKKRTIRNPRLRLTAETLKGNRGIHTIEKHFENVKYHGKGHEKKDLNEIIRRMQHWAHRMYPNYKFDDVILNIERLGKKKPLQVHMQRYRLDQLEPEIDINNDEQIENQNLPNDIQNEPFDEFDALLDEQIAISKLAPKTPGSKSANMSMSSSIFHTPKLNQGNAVMSTPFHREQIDDDDLAQPLPLTPKPKLSTEQMAKIAENRKLAQEKLKAKRESLAAAPIML